MKGEPLVADGCLTDISDGQTSDIRPGPLSCGSTKGGGWIRREEADSAEQIKELMEALQAVGLS